MKAEKPLYIEHPEDFLSWCLMRISETGQWEEAIAQFYASFILTNDDVEDQLPEFLSTMENLYKKVYHLINHKSEIWEGLMPGPGLPVHDVWTAAIEKAKLIEFDEMGEMDKAYKEVFETTWYALGPDNEVIAIWAGRRNTTDVLDFASELLDRHFAVHWTMDPLHADHVHIRLGGEQWLMNRTNAKQIVGLQELASSHLDLDTDGQIVSAILGNMKDAAEDWEKRGILRDF
jgi:hypothetical protein